MATSVRKADLNDLAEITKTGYQLLRDATEGTTLCRIVDSLEQTQMQTLSLLGDMSDGLWSADLSLRSALERLGA